MGRGKASGWLGSFVMYYNGLPQSANRSEILKQPNVTSPGPKSTLLPSSYLPGMGPGTGGLIMMGGEPLGSILDSECQIDAIAQSWALLSGAGNLQRSRQAMQSVLERLVRPQERLVLLFTPPFDKTPRDSGYIKGYLPGIRENGGQYTHAAAWTAWAFTNLGDGKQAGALFDLLNPVFQSDTVEKSLRLPCGAICGLRRYLQSAPLYTPRWVDMVYRFSCLDVPSRT